MKEEIKKEDTIENLMIYKQYLELIYYTENILKKYPKSERFALSTTIKNNTYEGIKYILLAYNEPRKDYKYSYLNKLDTNLKMLKVFIRLSYRLKYINAKNYAAWSKKLTNLGNLLGGWIKVCRKV